MTLILPSAFVLWIYISGIYVSVDAMFKLGVAIDRQSDIKSWNRDRISHLMYPIARAVWLCPGVLSTQYSMPSSSSSTNIHHQHHRHPHQAHIDNSLFPTKSPNKPQQSPTR
jgi:hypothetical protein